MKMEKFVLNHQVDTSRKNIENYEFRLQNINLDTDICNNKDLYDDTTSVSSYSHHKHRIDAMFDDGKSVISDVSRDEKSQKLVISKQYIHQKTQQDNPVANNIQEKIEKMFEEISLSKSSNVSSITYETSQKESIKPSLFPSQSTVKDFKVTYLGSKPLKDKNINLEGLQDPLRELYFMYKKNPSEFNAGFLTICEEGLTIKTLNKKELNPFSAIAVWASVKLAFRAESGSLEFAFLPLIADPDGSDKNSLFKHIDSEDKNYFFQNLRDDNQFPIFAVVIKNINLNKQLECHGFICNSSEDAIVIAANLYHALIKKLKRKRKHKEDKIKENNEKVTVFNTEEQEVSEMKPKIKVKKPVLVAPAKPPRKIYQEERKYTTSDCGSKTFDTINHQPSESNEKTENSRNLSQRRRSVPDATSENKTAARTLRRAASDCGGNNVLVKNQCEGDILTKVAIPRSQSFLNANGPLLRFSIKNKTHAKNEVLSPLGFNELFDEFRLHEGLKSMDEILSVIIDAEGMSFNDLKPIYKDFLLKLAVILTKDELYHRSKIIMKRQKKRNKNYNSRKELFKSSLSLTKMFHKTSKTKKRKGARPTNLEFTSVIFQSSANHWESKWRKVNTGRSKSVRIKTKPNRRRKLTKRVSSKILSGTSDESDVIRPVRTTSRDRWIPHMSSSGYVSYSECSYDSENCTCTCTDKCYCTLSKIKADLHPSSLESPAKNKSSYINLQSKINREHEDSLKTCSCDTSSCAESGKCYCVRKEIRKFYSKLFRMPDVTRISQTSNFPKTDSLHKTIRPRYIEDGGEKHDISVPNHFKKDRFSSTESSLSQATILEATCENTANISERKRHSKTNKKAQFLPLYSLRQDQQILRNLPKSNSYSKSKDYHFKEFQSLTPKTQYFGKPVHTCWNKDLDGKAIGKCNTHLILKPSCGKRHYSSVRCRNEFLSDLTISKPLHRSMSYRTKYFFSSVRSKQNCGDIMNHIKFPISNYSNSSLRFRRRMDVYDSSLENSWFSLQKSSIHHPQKKKDVKQNLFQKPFRPGDLKEFGDNRNRAYVQRAENEAVKTVRNENLNSSFNSRSKKMLVVSARDPKGKVLYFGASNNKCDSVKTNIFLDTKVRANEGEAMAVKKSVEIASLFSDSLVQQKLRQAGYVSVEKENDYLSRSKSYDLEHGLGYLP